MLPLRWPQTRRAARLSSRDDARRCTGLFARRTLTGWSVSKEKKASDSRLNLSCDGEGEGDGVERYALDDVDLGRHLPLLFCGGLELGGWDSDSGSVVRVGFGEEEGYGEG